MKLFYIISAASVPSLGGGGGVKILLDFFTVIPSRYVSPKSKIDFIRTPEVKNTCVITQLRNQSSNTIDMKLVSLNTPGRRIIYIRFFLVLFMKIGLTAFSFFFFCPNKTVERTISR